MKKTYKIIGLIAFMGAIISFIISATINLLLNKKYAVDEIKYTERKQGLEGIQEIITTDYINTIYSNAFIIVLLIGFTIIFLFQMKNKK